jgi:PAS domain S-box-containing protein
MTQSGLLGRASSRAESARLSVAGVVLAVLILAGSLAAGAIGDSLLLALALPLVLGASAYGTRGGAVFSVLCFALAAVWWLVEGTPGGVVWLGSRLVVLLGIGLLLGWFVDSRRALIQELASHAELSLDLIATASYDGYFTRVNPAFTRTLGYSTEELLSRPFVEFVHPDDIESTNDAVTKQIEAGHEVLNFQNRYRAKDGSYRWLEWMSHPDPARRRLVAVARDVTDRKLLEDQEHRHQLRLEDEVAERTQELEEAHEETLRRLALAAEFRDDETQAHNERVSRTAGLIAAELGLERRLVKLIGEAALLHDVGKVGVSDAILFKPGPLTPAELDHVHRHAETGASILSGSHSEVLRIAEEIARSHHEWWDGTGYPDGLSGTAIPLSARIAAIADVYDALTNTRPYKRPWPAADALAEILSLAGRQFDPDAVRAFARVHPRELDDTTIGKPDVLVPRDRVHHRQSGPEEAPPRHVHPPTVRSR